MGIMNYKNKFKKIKYKDENLTFYILDLVLITLSWRKMQ